LDVVVCWSQRRRAREKIVIAGQRLVRLACLSRRGSAKDRIRGEDREERGGERQTARSIGRDLPGVIWAIQLRNASLCTLLG
jgi:hypothetical protein